MGMIQEFKTFAVKGNFLDLAVGVIMGAASGKVVTALVEKVIMPPIGVALGRVDFSKLRIPLVPASKGPDGKDIAEVAIGYGAAIQAAVELLIIAFIVFLIVRAFNKFKKEAPPAGPSAEEKLLGEIRDLLKDGAKSKEA